MNFPLLIFAGSFVLMWVAALAGSRLGAKRRREADKPRDDFNTVQAATLTLLGLIIGFSFSMATGRYDLRKTYEEAEANAIGTEYVRADVIPGAGAAQVKNLLKQYTDLRIRFYMASRWNGHVRVDAETAAVQAKMWSIVAAAAADKQTAVMNLVMSGMNDVLNSQGYTQAAWWNRIPTGAWLLMFAIAIFCNGLLGYGARTVDPRLFVLLPVVIGVAFFLIADIDSPRGGVIRVIPQNLISLRESLGQ
jgi:hypothetical protein